MITAVCAMKQNVYVTDALADASEATEDIAAEESSIHQIDPLIQPLIDTDELSVRTEGKNDELVNLDIKANTVDSPHSRQSPRVSLLPENLRRYDGIFYALLSSSLFTSSGFIIKQLRVDFFDALLCRFVVQTLILTVFILTKRYAILVGSRSLILLQIIRVILAVCGLLSFYLSYRYIPLPDLTTFRYTQVMWTALLSMVILRERISVPTMIAIVLTLLGVVCVAQPTFLFGSSQRPSLTNQTKSDADYESNGSYRVLGLAFALVCALSLSSSIVLNKKLLVLKIPQSVLMFHFSCLTLIILICNQLRNRFILHVYEHRSMFTWQFSVAASVSLLQLLSSTLTQKALKLEHPSILSVVQSSDILFALLLQNLIADAKSNWLVFVGSALVTTSIFLVGIHKIWNDRKAPVLEDVNPKNLKV